MSINRRLSLKWLKLAFSHVVRVLPQITICIHVKAIIEEIHKFLRIEFLYYFSCFVFYVYDLAYFEFFVFYINGISLVIIIQFSSPSGPKWYGTSPPRASYSFSISPSHSPSRILAFLKETSYSLRRHYST